MSWTFKLEAWHPYPQEDHDLEQQDAAWRIVEAARDQLAELGLSVNTGRHYNDLAFSSLLPPAKEQKA